MIIKNQTSFKNKILKIYENCITLIEEVAAYTDQEGQEIFKKLPLDLAKIHQNEIFRMNTRLMHTMSWLLLWRAGEDKEMSQEQILLERTKISLKTEPFIQDEILWQKLPAIFRKMVQRSLYIEAKLRLIDQDLKSVKHNVKNIIGQQQKNIEEAFK